MHKTHLFNLQNSKLYLYQLRFALKTNGLAFILLINFSRRKEKIAFKF